MQSAPLCAYTRFYSLYRPDMAKSPNTPHRCAAPLELGVDSETIRATCNTVLTALGPVPSEVRGLLRGHVQLLVPEVTAAVPRMRREWKPIAEQVLARTRELPVDGADVALWDLATQCRALLRIHEQGSHLDSRAATDGGRP